MSKSSDDFKTYWRKLEPRGKTRLRVFGPKPGANEFPVGAEHLEVPAGEGRRQFLSMLGASAALAGTVGGCVRKPNEKIMPFADRPEDLIPGRPQHYATAMQVGSTVMGLTVVSQDGRPTKVDGNRRHAGSQGGTNVWAQASVLDLYDVDRTRVPQTVWSAAHGEGGDEATAKRNAKASLCEAVHARAFADSKSVDRALAESASCEQAVEANGKWTVEPSDKGVRATVRLEGTTQLPTAWDVVWAQLDALSRTDAKTGGGGTALVVAHTQSPTQRSLLREYREAFPKARVFLSDATTPLNAIAGAEMVAGKGARAFHSLRRAKVILSADSDFLGTDQDHVRMLREWARNRRMKSPSDPISRLYVVEPHLTSTGGAADNRLAIPGRDVTGFLAAVADRLTRKHKQSLAGTEPVLAAVKGAAKGDSRTVRWAKKVADDLAKNKGRAVVVVGERQPPVAHALGLLINGLLGDSGTGVPGHLRLRYDVDAQETETLAALTAGLNDGSISRVVCLDTNPVYDAPGRLGFAEALTKAELVVHAGQLRDETAQVATAHLPLAHYLEAWGDLESIDGTTTICQPLIAPLHEGPTDAGPVPTPSLIELLHRLIHPGEMTSGHEIVRAFWAKEVAQDGAEAKISDRRWSRWLHDGVVTGIPRTFQVPKLSRWDDVAEAYAGYKPGEGTEVNFHLDPKVGDGRFANNAWLQECPHPVSKLVWDNAAYLSPAYAETLGVANGDLITVSVDGRSVKLPVWVAPGQAPDTVSLTLGYGRKNIGAVAEGAGFDVNGLRDDHASFFASGSVAVASGTYQLVSTQDYGSLDPDGDEGSPLGFNYERRPIYREATVAEFKEDPAFSRLGDLMPKDRLKSLWDRPELTGPHQWGMVIDLNGCVGCNACVVACQAENNIPVVGKKEAGNGRELHWLRLDRYYSGDPNKAEMVIQPVACMHCETAPCENVCPVGATAHSPEGLNDMAYNRCIGTRYCSNNCPYKVRRFNYFNYNLDLDPLEQMQKNPDVTVRFRGVIEKCTYCVQRINRAKSDAHIAGETKVKDGVIRTACEDACPTQCVTFGDISDPKSRVSRIKEFSRNYSVLADLNTHPRTTYLARVRNPNPELENV
ncbi:MAG: 4Fe-4S dicluster domain-containing protein [Myxococcales bacterium FL481]|nr:MAG: 4Fe-4S dicluster domain-containing protein [Myxococcales bacterium FL481]